MLHKKLKDFPADFFWGGSTSAYQVEGAWDEDRAGAYFGCFLFI
jgi:6-phospho-beta-glucosidase